LIWLFAAFLVVWGNVQPPLIGGTAVLPGGSWAFVAAGVGLAAAAFAAAYRARLDVDALGVSRGHLARGVLVGALAGSCLAAASLVALPLAPMITGRPIVYEPLYRVSGTALATHVAVFLPLGVVLPEELAFRGTLFGLLRRISAPAAMIGSAATFALWHAAVAVVTVGDTTLGPPSPWFVPAVGGALLVVFVGGMALAALRLRARSLGATIAAHWTFNGVLLVGLWATMPPARLVP
jgi:membrane protease YdiL (CAAX protease family)